MIPATWLPHHREDDGEVIGYLAPSSTPDETVELFVPMTVFGYAMADAVELDDARAALDAVGLSLLAEPWILHRAGIEPTRVRIAEVTPARIVVGVDDFNVGIDYASCIVLDVPTGRALTPAR
ncbi:hypothetical protein [Frondihabitans sucicola]|nr:hypothetical protein [Frondihabitans sucicola]